VGTETGKIFWKISGWNRNLFKGIGKKNFYIYNLGGVSGFGISSSKQLNPTNPNGNIWSLTSGVSLTKATDTSRTNLFDTGLLTVFTIKVTGSRGLTNDIIMLDFSPRGISDWSFTRLTLINKYEKRKSLFGLRIQDILGYIWTDSKGVPVQERFTIEGAGSGTTYEKAYLRDATSFYGNIDLRNRYHLPGDANLRAFGNQGFVGVEKIFAITLEGFIYKKLGGSNLELAAFLDEGTLSGSKFVLNDKGFKDTRLMDYGIGLRLSTTVFGQPIYLRIDKPLKATIDGKSIEEMNDWVFSFQKSI
jgi:hypothetical protein